MQIRFGNVKKIGRIIGITGENSYLFAVFLALFIVIVVIGSYYVVFKPQPEPYNTIYLLDAQQLAVNYPQVLDRNLNSTFSVYVNVENHLGGIQNQTYQVQIKITQNISTFPVQAQIISAYDLSLADGNTWSKLITIAMNDVGDYWVVFELYENIDGDLWFTQNYCVLNIQIVS